MKLLRVIFEVVVLSLIYLAGVWVQKIFHLFIPGSMIGMIFLFLLLQFRIIKVSWIQNGSTFLIRYLPLLFLPVTVAVITYGEIFTVKGILIVLSLILGTALVMVCTGIVSQRLMAKKELEYEHE